MALEGPQKDFRTEQVLEAWGLPGLGDGPAGPKPLTAPEQLQRLACMLAEEGGLEGAAVNPLEGHGAR